MSRVLIDRASSHAGSPDLAGPLIPNLSTHGASFHAATAAARPQFSQSPLVLSDVQMNLIRIAGYSSPPPVVEAANAFSLSAAKYAGLCGTVLCFAMNPKTGNMVQVRALLDSGANLTMLNRSVAQAIGLTGNKIQLSIDVAGGGSLSRKETEVAFQLVKKDKSSVTMPLVGITTEKSMHICEILTLQTSSPLHERDHSSCSFLSPISLC